MKKSEVISKLLDCGVIAVIRGNSTEEAVKLSKACAKGGIVGLEVTFTVPGAKEVIEALVKEKDSSYIVGAGTVLDATTARIAILAGAQFVVSPNFDRDVCELCNLYKIPYMAGVFTINEVVEALKAGVEVCKIFPGSLAGPDYIKAIHGPLPQADCMPTGGVDLNNVEEWIKKGAVAVGTGSNLTAPAKTGDFDKVTELAKQYVEKVKEARK
ncbi:MAG: bifunctional 2-keto-4-hydroxyglutarate aldolase/2-keto-3-deoxy-6-phosphogluconate aldolase [Bacilli bacterium]|nr:bifunctional 2-keto-4-hydroxyglutarate aldolase/2-keto-3-deoxy-6-phosphogluconate aldolase [Bacilli bacterium]MBO6285966.1 bifunctional 2-keto-4-hydroxyglutarate aldolase/2-keto-3-deoxy-6-phosphogluconate aldolase [Bacilli bacterium]